MQEIADWLEKLGMSEYAQRFAEHRIDFSALSDLTDADLKDLGVVLGDRRKILRAIATLDATSETAVLIRKPPSTPSVAEVQGLPIAEGNTEQRDVTLYGITQAAEGENPRTNYNRLIGWAVKGLDGSTAEGRQVVYERARAALTAHLRLNQVGLLEADIVKERLALEEAIRGVEAEAAQKSRTEMPTASPPDTPPASASNVDGSCEPFRDGNGNPASADVPEVRLAAVVPDEPQGRQSWREGARGFRDVVSEVPGFAAIIGTAAQTGLHARAARHPETYRPESSLAQGGLARLLVVATMVIAVVATVFWQWSAIWEFYQFLNLTGPEPRGDVTHNTPTAQSKTAVGVAQQQSNADAHRPTLPNGQTLPAGQQALLYEEDPTDPQGKRYTGSAIWRTETISTMAGLAP